MSCSWATSSPSASKSWVAYVRRPIRSVSSTSSSNRVSTSNNSAMSMLPTRHHTVKSKADGKRAVHTSCGTSCCLPIPRPKYTFPTGKYDKSVREHITIVQAYPNIGIIQNTEIINIATDHETNYPPVGNIILGYRLPHRGAIPNGSRLDTATCRPRKRLL